MSNLLELTPLAPSYLRRIPVLVNLPDTKLQWMIDHGQEMRLNLGEQLVNEGDPANCVFLMLEGSFRLTQRVGNQDILVKLHDRPTLFGEVPLLMGVPNFWASGRAVTECRLLKLSADHFWKFMGLCPTLAKAVLQGMVARIQEVQVLAQHRERLVSLGTLAAGLAHELNNPAAAARRAARELRQVFPVLQTQTLKLTQKALTDYQRDFLFSLQQTAIDATTHPVLLDPLSQSDREDEILQWMDDHQIGQGWKLSSALVSAGLDRDWLDNLVAQMGEVCLQEVLLWFDATLTVAGLLSTLGHSTSRIYQLVEAVQDYSAWDSQDFEAVDLHTGLENTLTLLHHKLKQGVTVIRDYAEDLPPVRSSGHELEQVWMNMLDNAIDAVLCRFNQDASVVPSKANFHAAALVIPQGWQGSSHHSFSNELQQPTIWIHTRCEAEWVLVEIGDNGSGIAPDVQPHIFEPFFTTKGVGKGTGLGLNTSYKIVERHQGDIRVRSTPGDTCFQVRLPSAVPSSACE